MQSSGTKMVVGHYKDFNTISKDYELRCVIWNQWQGYIMNETSYIIWLHNFHFVLTIIFTLKRRCMI